MNPCLFVAAVEEARQLFLARGGLDVAGVGIAQGVPCALGDIRCKVSVEDGVIKLLNLARHSDLANEFNPRS